MTIFNKPIDQIIKERHSVRNYLNKIVDQNIKDDITKYIKTITNPFNINIDFIILDDSVLKDDKIGTYGSIKNAKNYLVTKVKKQDFDLEALGYSFEVLIIYLTSLGIGTCWIGGFNKDQILKYVNINKEEILPIISPFGYENKNISLKDKVLQRLSDKKNRKTFESIFFDNDFKNSIKYDNKNVYDNALEMVRIGPSSFNKQPWIILKQNNMYHFYEDKIISYNKKTDIDIKKIDMGIAMCHFELYLRENNIKGHFEKQDMYPKSDKNISYIISWICE